MKGDRKVHVLSDDDLVPVGRADLTAFTRWPLGMRGDYALWDCQLSWQHRIREAYLGKLKDPENGRHLVQLAPSEHGKTTSMGIPFALWALSKDRNLRIIVAGSKDSLAQNVGSGIDRHFANRPGDLGRFGLLQGAPWNAEEKYVQRDNDNLIHPSMLFVGPETEFQGKRADIIIATDLATFKNQRTKESRQKLSDWFYQTLMQRLEPWGFVLVEGHHVHPEDLYTELEEDPEFAVHKDRAILQEPSEENDGHAKILAPEHWSYSQLARKRERRPGVFQLIFQNTPTAIQGLVARENLERALDRSRPLIYTMRPEVREAYVKIEMGVDPAFSLTRWASHSACWVRGVTAAGRKDFLGGWRQKLLPHQLEAKLVVTILAMRPDVVYIESNAAQIYLVENVRKAMVRHDVKPDIIQPVQTTATPEHTVEEAVSDCIVSIENGMSTFPYQGADAQELTEQLFTEILNYPPQNKHKSPDVLMAWVVLNRGSLKSESQVRKTIRTGGLIRSVASRRWRTPITMQSLIGMAKENHLR